MKIPYHRPYMSDNEINAATECIRNGWLTMGKKSIEFEKKFNEYLAVNESIAVNSCTAALHLALCCIDLKPNEEVLIPTTTFVSTAEVVRYFDAIPVMIDVERETHLIDVAKIEEKITKKTRAIIPVHFAGQPADMDEIMGIANKYNLAVIEDAAHALPSKYKNKLIGSIGDITCFSFYATKTLATGEGGMICTSNSDWAEKMRILRLHGISKDAWKRYSEEGSWKYDVIYTGYKYNPMDICSSIGLEQLKKIDVMNDQRKKIAQKYNDSFQNEEGLILYKIKTDRESSWHLFPLKLNIEILKITRDEFIEEMGKRGIFTSVHFIPLYKFNYYKSLGYNESYYPESEWIFDRTVSLPIYPGLSDDEIKYIIENVLDIIKSNTK
ncbi:MAG: DegT/DnrJ/EryC1/StrS family aminotransferase [Spirochaetes bacterium]|nr:DegT/DnrJ/EryC1/StrS family aminotransferase [Spirochaetota bacterium]